MFAKFGVTGSFNVLYISHPRLFPVLFSATAFGMVNMVARLFSALSPLLAQLDEPLPMIAFTTLTAMTCILALFIQTDVKKPIQETK